MRGITPKTPKSAGFSARTGSALTVEELGKLSADLDAYMDWAQVWHKQAGGYTASDTFLTMMRMEKWARLLAELTGKPETPLRKISDAERPKLSHSAPAETEGMKP